MVVERRNLKKAMKTVSFSTSASSNSATSTATAAAALEEDERSEARNRWYYPGCRKDANCNCKICLDSINATLDLMPYSVQKSSLMKLSASRPNVGTTPISFNPSILTTPTSGTSQILKYPKFISPVKFSMGFEAEEKEKDSSSSRSLRRLVTLVFVLSLIFAVTIGFSCAMARIQKRWGASPVQIDPHTWAIEYRLSSLLENSNLNIMAADFFKHWMSKIIRRLENELWLFLDDQTRATHDIKTPT